MKRYEYNAIRQQLGKADGDTFRVTAEIRED